MLTAVYCRYTVGQMLSRWQQLAHAVPACTNDCDTCMLLCYVLQIPLWWVHKGAQPAIEPLKGTDFIDQNNQISFYNIVQAQLIANADAVWLPKYLLVLYQLTM